MEHAPASDWGKPICRCQCHIAKDAVQMRACLFYHTAVGRCPLPAETGSPYCSEHAARGRRVALLEQAEEVTYDWRCGSITAETAVNRLLAIVTELA